jgi:hypothetical protein
MFRRGFSLGVVQILLVLDQAGFLKVAELGDGPFELAGEALAVEAEAGQGFRLVQETVDEVLGGVGDAEEIGLQ